MIDTGRVREVRRNQRTSTSILVTDWCSRASAKQRAGRAGRVQPGVCLKLYSSRTARSTMKASSEPELRRVPLEEVCLSILASGYSKSCMDFLLQAPQPPSEASVIAAVRVLEEVGAIAIHDDPINPRQRTERLTGLGQQLARLPVDVRLGKILIYGAIFNCLDKALTIAASLSSQSPFSTFVEDASIAQSKHRAFADPDSDFLTLCNVWEGYAQAKVISGSHVRKFCRSNYISFSTMREIADSRRQFLDLLCSTGMVDRKKIASTDADKKMSCNLEQKVITSVYNENGENRDVIHAVVCAGLYPNIGHLRQPVSGDYTLYHKQERLYFHKTSINGKKKRFVDNSWVVFHEKFGTQYRVSVACTSMVHPFTILLFGGSISVHHVQRTVTVDDWIEIGMAAQVAVVLRELRKQIDELLKSKVNNSFDFSVGADSQTSNKLTSQRDAADIVKEIVGLLVAGSAAAVSKYMATGD